MSDIVEKLKGQKALHAELDRAADGADVVDHKGKSYTRSGPKDQTSQPGKWRLAKKKVKEGMDDAEGGEHLHVTGPEVATNPAAEQADALLQAAERLSGFILRTPNGNNPQLAARIERLYLQVADICAEIEGEM